jgi:hypothetical protein
MIIIRLMGGLGNQMFQYAFAKSLSIRYNKKLIIDNTLLNKLKKNPEITPREYELNAFGIKYTNPFLLKIYLFFLKFIKKSLVYIKEENPYEFKNINLISNKDYLITGYFQSHKYFYSINNNINYYFSFKPLHSSYLSLQNLILGLKNSVSVLVRRDDFLFLNDQNVLDENYYYNSFELIKTKIKNPTFIIFTIGDTAWTNEKFSKLNNCIIIENHIPKLIGYEKLYLITLCDHNIIANSSYGWWGAHLNNNPKKVIIAPRKWDSDINTNTLILQNRLPSNWDLI